MNAFVDARGLACPQPVILAKRAMNTAGGHPVVVLTSTEDQADNVIRMARELGWTSDVEITEQGARVVLTPAPSSPTATISTGPIRPQPSDHLPGAKVVLLTSTLLGRGAEELGRVLMRGFLSTLNELDERPATVILLSAGVHLAMDGAETVGELKDLVEKGTELLVCGTCASYYDIRERIAVGTISNMHTIAERLLSADNVVAP